MALQPSKFKLDEEVSFAGKPMRVAGLVQLEAPDAQLATRYLLAGATGAPQIVEETGGKFSLLRAFPPASLPQASGNTVTVMGEKYTLKGVRKLKVLGAAGQAPGGASAAAVLLSGVFEGAMGSLLREIVPGASAQAFFSVKAVGAEDLQSAAELAEQQEVARLAAEDQAEAEEETGSSGSGGLLKNILGWGFSILVIVGLGYACSGSDEEGSSSDSARSSVRYHSGGSSGGK